MDDVVASNNGVSRVIDIGGSHVDESIRKMIDKKMFPKTHVIGPPCVLPSPLLSDEEGLVLWSRINRLPSYYQTAEEIQLLERYGEEIVGHLRPGSVLIDLGMGDIRKVKPLLDVIESHKISVDYYALDLACTAVSRAVSQLDGSFEYIRCFGLWGTFSDGLRWSSGVLAPKWILSLGSSFGNDWFEPAVDNLKAWAQSMRPTDRMLLAMDGTYERNKLWSSYHDKEGLFETFIRNGLLHANRVMGAEWYHEDDWEVEGVMLDKPVMHRFVIRALRDVHNNKIGINFAKGHEIECYEAFKYGPDVMRKQFSRAGLIELASWTIPSSQICV